MKTQKQTTFDFCTGAPVTCQLHAERKPKQDSEVNQWAYMQYCDQKDIRKETPVTYLCWLNGER